MNLNIYCSVTISKKLAKICKNNPSFLSIQPSDNDKMVGLLKITCADDIKPDDVKKIEDINIMLGIEDVSEDVKDLGDEKPIASLYISGEKIENSKLAIANPDSEIKTYKNRDKVEKQKERVFSKNKNISGISKNFVSDYDDLIKIVSAIKDIDNEIPTIPSNKKMSRGEAIEFEKSMKSVPRLSLGVYVSNETKGRLCVDDLNLVFNINEIIDLSSIPAKKIKDSRELRVSCEKCFIKFRSKGEYNEWCKKQFDVASVVDKDFGLKIFDNHDEAVEATENIMENTDVIAKDGQSDSKPSVFTNKVNIIKKSDNSIMPTNIKDGETIEVTGDEETEEEIETKELISDLPEDRDDEKENVDNAQAEETPLLSDMVEKQEKNKIKRI